MQPPHNPEPCLLRGNPKFELEVVPVLAGVTAVGVGWDEELPPHSWWHYSQSRGMWLSPYFLPVGNLRHQSIVLGHAVVRLSCVPSLCPLSRVLRRTRVNGDNRL